MSKATWDTELGYKMYLAGNSDTAIGKAVGVTASTVNFYKRKHWLPKTPVGGGQLKPRSYPRKRGGTCYAS